MEAVIQGHRDTSCKYFACKVKSASTLFFLADGTKIKETNKDLLAAMGKYR